MTTSGIALIDPNKIFAKVGLTTGMRVADFGCGRTGHFVFSAARKVGDAGVVYAVDVVKEVLNGIRSRIRSEGYDNVQTVWADIESVGKTAIPAESLDGCFIINIMFLAKNKKAVLEEAFRLLKKGGFIVVIDWKKNVGGLGPLPEMMVATEVVERIAHEQGLTVVETFGEQTYHYCLILKK